MGGSSNPVWRAKWNRTKRVLFCRRHVVQNTIIHCVIVLSLSLSLSVWNSFHWKHPAKDTTVLEMPVWYTFRKREHAKEGAIVSTFQTALEKAFSSQSEWLAWLEGVSTFSFPLNGKKENEILFFKPLFLFQRLPKAENIASSFPTFFFPSLSLRFGTLSSRISWGGQGKKGAKYRDISRNRFFLSLQPCLHSICTHEYEWRRRFFPLTLNPIIPTANLISCNKYLHAIAECTQQDKHKGKQGFQTSCNYT